MLWETSAPQRSEPESRSWLFCSTSYRGLNSPASQINKFCYIKLGFIDGRSIFAVLPLWKATVMPIKMFLLHLGGRKSQIAACLRGKLSHGETKSAWVVTGLGFRFGTFQHVTGHLWFSRSYLAGLNYPSRWWFWLTWGEIQELSKTTSLTTAGRISEQREPQTHWQVWLQ